MLPLFAFTLFASAFLLFLVQPMAAKLVLPTLGGSPAVWNTCMVFFQAALLAGYASAHGLSKLRPRLQLTIYGLALAAPIILSLVTGRLLIASPEGRVPPPDQMPILWLLGLLAFMVGAPFLIISAAAPLLQRWFAGAGHRASGDPYFLYAASNAGSMLALLAYPLVIEPLFPLAAQRTIWSVGFTLFAMLAVACGFLFIRSSLSRAADARHEAPATPPPPPTDLRTRLWWIFLAFVPSSYMLGVTQFVSTDIAAVPLLWVGPLAIYLLTFILAFSKWKVPTRSISRILPILMIGLAVAAIIAARRPLGVLITLHMSGLFLSALLCHARLAESRPDPRRLTEFYLLIALGGVLGGIFNALAAPLLFTSIAEYPIAIALAMLARLPQRPAPENTRQAWTTAFLGLAAAVVIAIMLFYLDLFAIRTLGLTTRTTVFLIWVGPPAVLCFLLNPWPRIFALGLATMFASSLYFAVIEGRLLHAERTFFGVYRVNQIPRSNPTFTQMVHGTTVHGIQFIDPQYQRTPLGYYHPDGPIGDVFKTFGKPGPGLFDRVGLVGLGAGALASYGLESWHLTFHEIDPAVVRIAEDTRLFTYLNLCKAEYDIALGDGRLTIADVPDGEYGLIVLDAFSSDSIPIHLLTREALELYLRKLKPGGLLAFHISNQHLNLAPILARHTHDLGLAAIHRNDDDERIQRQGDRFICHWVVLARAQTHLAPLAANPNWSPLRPNPNAPLWTDDFSNILSAFNFN